MAASQVSAEDWGLNFLASSRGKQWFNALGYGIREGLAGNHAVARSWFVQADAISTEDPDHAFWTDPSLSMLRFGTGTPVYSISKPYEINERVMLGLQINLHHFPEAETYEGLAPPVIDQATMESGIRSVVAQFEPNYHVQNLRMYDEQPHLMVLSTGRAGTVSLYHLLKETQYIPYHSNFYTPAPETRQVWALQVSTNHVLDQRIPQFWAVCRAAEWLGAASADAPAAMCMHYDTPFAPFFLAMHRHSRFINLRRDPVKVFKSFYSKNQWSGQQVEPSWWDFDEVAAWKRTDWDEVKQIAWYIRWTECFMEAFSEVAGDQCLTVSSDKLFAQDATEVDALMHHLNLKIPHSQVKDHFKLPINEKRDRVERDPEPLVDEFLAHYRSFGGEL